MGIKFRGRPTSFLNFADGLAKQISRMADNFFEIKNSKTLKEKTSLFLGETKQKQNEPEEKMTMP